MFRARGATNFSVTYDGDNLYPAAPDFHFLTPKVVARLRDSADTQAFISQLTIFGGQNEAIIRQTHARLVVSYSIWEDTFTVAIPGLQHSQEGLSAAKAESWCLENLAISASGLDPNKPFRMRFELRRCAADGSQPRAGGHGDQHREHDRYLQPQSRSGRRDVDPGDGLAAVDRPAAAFRPARAPRVNRLRNRLILVFLAATLAPLGATLWVTGLLKWNPNYTAVNQMKTLAQSLGRAGTRALCPGARATQATGAERTTGARKIRANRIAQRGRTR